MKNRTSVNVPAFVHMAAVGKCPKCGKGFAGYKRVDVMEDMEQHLHDEHPETRREVPTDGLPELH